MLQILIELAGSGGKSRVVRSVTRMAAAPALGDGAVDGFFMNAVNELGCIECD